MTSFSSGRELLLQVISRYRALDSYADTGQVLDLTKPRSAPLVFATALRRPDFKFSFSSPHPYRPLSHLVTRTQIGVREGRAYFWDQSYSASSKLEQEESLLMAIAGATGISRGSAHTIWSLLFGDEGRDFFSSLTRPRLRRFSNFDGVRCHRLVAQHPGFRRVEFHIGVDDLLLRALVTRPGRYANLELRTDIKLGVELSDAELDVPPPVDGSAG